MKTRRSPRLLGDGAGPPVRGVGRPTRLLAGLSDMPTHVLAGSHMRLTNASARGADGVPMLVCEIRHVEAAMVNLESYSGHETMLCERHTLLERFAVLGKQARTGWTEDGILRLPRSTPQAPCG